MYVVIFRAQIADLDDDYFQTANELRELALSQFGCREFVAIAEGEAEGHQEIALSYWDSLEQIQAWHQFATHQAAQRSGYEKWYASVRVEVTQVIRQYGSGVSRE